MCSGRLPENMATTLHGDSCQKQLSTRAWPPTFASVLAVLPGSSGETRGRARLSLDNLCSNHQLYVSLFEVETSALGEVLDILRVGEEPACGQCSITPKSGYRHCDESRSGVSNARDDGVVLL